MRWKWKCCHTTQSQDKSHNLSQIPGMIMPMVITWGSWRLLDCFFFPKPDLDFTECWGSQQPCLSLLWWPLSLPSFSYSSVTDLTENNPQNWRWISLMRKRFSIVQPMKYRNPRMRTSPWSLSPTSRWTLRLTSTCWSISRPNTLRIVNTPSWSERTASWAELHGPIFPHQCILSFI